MHRSRFLFTAAAILIAAAFAHSSAANAYAQESSDQEAIRAAVLDYVEGIYNNDPARVERSVHPKLAKIGFYRKPTDATYGGALNMTQEQLVNLARNFNKDGKLAKDAPKEIVIYDVLDQTATVKLTAAWGTDYMHLAKFDGKWMIINVLWQSHPKK